MSQILIKNIEHAEKVSKEGKPYTSCKITAWSDREGKNVTISGFGDAVTKTWNANDTVDIEVEKNERGYLNFKLNEFSRPSPNPVVTVLEKILVELKILNGTKVESIAKDFGGTVVDEKEPGIKPGDTGEITLEQIPF